MCSNCGRNFPQLTPRHFSFNNRLGACSSCEGIGRSLTDQQQICEECNGTRLDEFPRNVQFSNKTIAELMAISISETIKFLDARIDTIEKHLTTAAGAKEAKQQGNRSKMCLHQEQHIQHFIPILHPNLKHNCYANYKYVSSSLKISASDTSD